MEAGRYPDGSLPNHFADDIGDPYTCKEAHNHPSKKEIRQELAWRRREATAEWLARGVLFGLGFLFFLGVYALADLMF